MSTQLDAVITKFDRWFKNLNSDWYTDEGGNIEAPTGAFEVVHVDVANVRVSWIKDRTQVSDDDNLPPVGWYLIQHNSNGLVYVYTGTREEVEARFAELETEFAEWDAA